MLILALLPGVPEEVVMFNPGTLPCNICVALVAGRSIKSLLETVDMAPVRLTRFWVPYPTTTTSSSVLLSSAKVTGKKVFPATVTVLVTIPTYDIFNFALGCTLIENFPSISEITPLLEPSSLTVAPIIGSPFGSVITPSTTFAVTCRFCSFRTVSIILFPFRL